MLAEGAHPVADTVKQVFLLVSINLSNNPADKITPTITAKSASFWVFLAAVFIFVAGAMFSLYDRVNTLREGGRTMAPSGPATSMAASSSSRCGKRAGGRTMPGWGS